MAKECIQHGCTTLVKHGSRCDKHNAHQQYKRGRTDMGEQSFYKSGQWGRVRSMALHRDNHMCTHCKQPAQMVDHIIPIKRDWSLRLVLSNLQSLCHSCHRIKTQSE